MSTDTPLLPDGGVAPAFTAPWQAQAFALVLALHERGAFSWPEWAQALARAIQRAQAAGDPDRGDTYYAHWLDALEALVIDKGLAGAEQLHALEHAWADAAARTPHGQPIVLPQEDLALAGPTPHSAEIPCSTTSSSAAARPAACSPLASAKTRPPASA